MNQVFIHGRLTRDPEIRYTSGENSTAVAKYGIAVNRPGKDKGADFFDCTAFGKNAEFAEKYLKKGTAILIQGSLRQDTWTDKNGQKRSSVGIIVERHEFTEKKDERDRIPDPKAGSEFMEIPDGDEELPFTF